MCSLAQQDERECLRWLSLAFPIPECAAAEVWNDELWHRMATETVRRAREAGALALLPTALIANAGFRVVSGELASAATLIEEANAIIAATGHRPLRYHLMTLAAWRGDPDVVVGMLDKVAAEGTAKGEGRAVGTSAFFGAVLYNGLGRYEEALAAARQACEDTDLGTHNWSLTELIEAAAHTGQRQTAEQALRRLEERAAGSGSDWGLGTLASAQALLADDEQADVLFTEAIERLGRTRIVVDLARAHLRYGEWLRRVNRRSDARQHLGRAHEMFTKMGAQAFAERTRRELVAVGEKVRTKPVGSTEELTAQEGQIARLAGDGLTNQEIGAQLFISTHTVEWHLRKVFVKLGITSRRQLRTISWAS
jgi:DNA-binding CsgD family transcriptional regulator